MRRKLYPILGDIKGLDKSLDPLLLPDLSFPDLNCVRFEQGVIKKDLGFVELGGNLPLDSRIMYFDQYFKQDGAAYTLCCTQQYLYKYNPSSGDWDVVNETDPFTGTEEQLFQSTIMNDTFIITNGKDPIKKWDGTTWADLGGLGTIRARYIVPFYNHLILGFTEEDGVQCPQRIRWSDTGDPETWTSGNAGFMDLSDTPDWVTGFALMGSKLYVFKEYSIWEVSYVGYPNIFSADMVVDGVGCQAPYTLTSLGSEIVFLGNDDVYSFDGRDVKPLGERIRKLIYDTAQGLINWDYIVRSPSVYVEELGEFWFVFPTTGTDPDLWLKLALDTEAWSKRSREVTALGFHNFPGNPTWLDLAGDWTAQTWTWGERKIRSGAPTTLVGTKDGYIYEDDRVTPSDETFILVTKDFMFGPATRVLGLKLLYKGGPLQVSYSEDGGSSWSTASTLPGASDWKEGLCKINRTMRKVRFRLETNAPEVEIKAIIPVYISRGREKEVTVA